MSSESTGGQSGGSDTSSQAAKSAKQDSKLAKMKKEGGQWKIVTLRVNSPVFDQDLASAKCPTCGAPHARDARFYPACGAPLQDEGKKSTDESKD